MHTKPFWLRRALLCAALAACETACSSDPAPVNNTADSSADTAPVDTALADVALPDVAPPDTAPADTTNGDAEPPDAPPADVASTDIAPVDTAPADVATADVATADVATADVATADVATADVAPMDAAPADTTPPDVTATDVPPMDLPPMDTTPVFSGPRIRALAPPSSTTGSSGFTLTISGVGFLPTSTVTWAGAPRAATYVDASTLRIEVDGTDLTMAGAAAVVVTNPGAGGGSATATFAIYVPFTSGTWLAGSTFRTAAGWFGNANHDRVWLADFNADHIDDIIGIADNGDVWVSRGTGSAFAGGAIVASGTVFRSAAGWSSTANQPRLWVADITGDEQVDLVGLDNAGGIWVSESTGTGFNASRSISTIGFATSAGYFNPAEHPHVMVDDVTGDGKADLVGINPSTGRISVAIAIGTGSTGSFAAEAEFRATSLFTSAALWFATTTQPRLFLGDVTGDRRADLVGLASNGDLYVAESTGTAMNVPRRVGSTVFSDANGFFATTSQPRVSLADFNGDGKLDIMGIAGTAAGDGDVWTLESIGTGSAADAYQHVLLSDSLFSSRDGWFTSGRRTNVWFSDVTGDGRADLIGVSSTGEVWVSRSLAESSSPGVTPAVTHDFYLPAVRTGSSNLASFFDPMAPRRLWLADVTGDGARDLVAISGAAGTDGDVFWRMTSPAMVQSITPVTRQMLTSGTPQRIQVNFTRRIAASSVPASALELAVDQIPVVPSGVMTTARGATFEVTFPVPTGADTRLDLTLGARATDAWGHGIDGNGDGIAGGLATRPSRWSPTLVAGAARVSLMPADPTGLPRLAGFGYCHNFSQPGTASASNPIEARVLVIAGGGACSTAGTCAAGQTCVAGQCQGAGGVDANLPLVIISLDLVGVNPGRLPELLASRYGIPKQNLIENAAHDHAAFRTINLFHAPYSDDRRTGGSGYLAAIEDRLADAVGAALGDLTPVEIASASALADLSYNRRAVAPPSTAARTVTAVELRTPGTPPRTRALLVNYAMHPVQMNGASGISADFPGFMRQALEPTRCAAGDTGCAVHFLQGGAGDTEPLLPIGNDDVAASRHQGTELARLVNGMTMSFRPTDRAQIQVQRRITNLGGLAACNVCTSEPAATAEPFHTEAPAVWSARYTAVSVGVPGAPLFRFGTLPGEAFSALQAALMEGLTPAPMLLGYTNGYLGYFPDRSSAGLYSTAYSVHVCAGGYDGGPTFFQSSGTAPTNGDNMVAGLRNALLNDLR